MSTISRHQIAAMIDHALLKPNLSDTELEHGCRQAREWQVASVCILPHWVEGCARLLAGSGVQTSTVIGFPHGVNAAATKAAEARLALMHGATELDMVVNISKVVSQSWQYVCDDIKAVLDEVRARSAKLKVIFENSYLNEQQKIKLCEVCSELAVDWVKTSTGFAAGGATVEDVRIMRAHCAPDVQIKASGGIRDLAAVLTFRDLGCSRIGCSNTGAILAVCTDS